MPIPERDRYRLAADIGGTFTDIVLLAPDGEYWIKKVSSTPSDYARGITDGVVELLADRGLDGDALLEIIHGTTIAGNAVLESKGAKTALITTRGFRDVLELRRLRVPHLYDVFYEPPKPLVERRLRLEVDERIGASGDIVQPLDEASVYAAVERIRNEGAQTVAVCLLHSYRNPAHERRVGEILKEELPDLFHSLSVDVLPEIREYERTSTTVVNAYLRPIVETYLSSLIKLLRGAGVASPVHVMQSNGGIMSAQRATETPVQLVESGPAAGTVAAEALGLRTHLSNLITFDMGGTTAKASLIENGSRSWTTEYEIGAGISLSSRLVKGGGHALKIPVMDLAEVGAGGGSIVWIDKGGGLRVGPRSAGAMPGPVSYGLGGEEPTVTDANVVLGYINPQGIAGGAVTLDRDLAAAALEEKVARHLELDLLRVAHGVHTVANVSMIRAIRAVSIYRGRDPRDFTMLAFGGSGPVHAAEMARSLGIGRVVVPAAPGVFSAVGLLDAQSEHHFVQTFFSRVHEVDLVALNLAYERMEAEAVRSLKEEGYEGSDVTWLRYADLRYVGQAYELTVGASAETLDENELDSMAERFQHEHERTYGHRTDSEPVELVNLRITARGNVEQSRPLRPMLSDGIANGDQRQAFFGSELGLLPTLVMARSDLSEAPRPGPLIVEEYDATVVVPPDCTAQLDEWDNIVIEVGQPGSG